MVQEGYSAIFAHPHLVLFPSIAIALVMLAFTFLGDGLRDALDPRIARAGAGTDEPQALPDGEIAPVLLESHQEERRAA